VNLDAYLHRIGYNGARTPTLDTLSAVQLHHTTAIAFENVNPLMRWPVPLDIPSLEAKLVHGGRGGWCFEHNALFMKALESLGFSVTPLAARVLWNVPEGVVTTRGHMLLKVSVTGSDYIADVGFGGQTLTGPLRLEGDIEQSTPHEPCRLLHAGEQYTLESKVAGNWKAMYRFDLQPQLLQDYEVSNHFLCTHPSSHFLKRLFVARPTLDRRYGLLNSRLSIHRLDGPSEHITLTTVAELRRVLDETFGLALPTTPEVDLMLSQAIANP
jgi:N-hydroxyarylamine O-acetyltransferase